MPEVLTESKLPKRLHRGKVRETHDLGDRLLIVATDRVSALDVILPTPIPRKGEVLTRLSAWWFQRVREVMPNHFISLVTADNAHELSFPLGPEYFGRSMIVRKAKRLPAECVVRGYLSGSGWSSYKASGQISGIVLPEGIRESDRLREPIFTPTTKADEGHDEAITYEQLEELVGEDAATAMRTRSLALYNYGNTVAQERGIIIADTKFEFGIWNEEVIVIDEVMTPDSSRFWPLESYRPGHPQASLDKQPIRDWLADTWKPTDPVPEIPPDIVAETTRRYLEVYKKLTGEDLPE